MKLKGTDSAWRVIEVIIVKRYKVPVRSKIFRRYLQHGWPQLIAWLLCSYIWLREDFSIHNSITIVLIGDSGHVNYADFSHSTIYTHTKISCCISQKYTVLIKNKWKYLKKKTLTISLFQDSPLQKPKICILSNSWTDWSENNIKIENFSLKSSSDSYLWGATSSL